MLLLGEWEAGATLATASTPQTPSADIAEPTNYGPYHQQSVTLETRSWW